MPDAVISCVDTVEKKIAFIRHAAGVLKLKNLKGHHARVEELAATASDIVISRAFASLTDFAEKAGKHVEAEGVLVAMKGKTPTQEMQDLAQLQRWNVMQTQILDVPELDAERCLIWMKQKDTQ
jgi:16S rRNA (guanine527-N7)-methyltransferase